MPTGPIACLSGCDRIAVNRGLCPACYNRLKAQVRASKTTWAELEAAGKALPARRRGSGQGGPRRRGEAT